MPELPEVHTISKDLTENIVGLKVIGIDVQKSYRTYPDNETFSWEMLNRMVTSVERVAKNLLIHLDSGNAIHMHLAMTGRVLLKAVPVHHRNEERWLRVALTLKDKAGNEKRLLFSDMRMFGKVGILTEAAVAKLRGAYGPDPLDSNLTPEEFFSAMRSRKGKIKQTLLDQHFLAGVGNIYATDALFIAKLHPETLARSITAADAKRLLTAIRTIITEGILHRGSTLKDKMYVDIFGREGRHQNYFRIYNKEKCPECATPVATLKIDGRITYFCPKCQVLNNQPTLI